MAQREATPTKAAYTLGDTEWKGMDTFTDPARLGVGVAQSIQNLVSDGMGSLILRNGWQGQFTTPLGAAIYEPTMLRTADGSTTKIVFVSGGKLYICDAGGTTYTELTKSDASSFSFTTSADVRMTQYGKYIYGVPGGTGKVFRTAGTGGIGGNTTEIVNLSAPASGGNLLTPRLRNWNQSKAAISADTDLSTGSPSLSSSSTLIDGGTFETAVHAFYVNNYVVGSNGSDIWKQGSTGSGSGASLKNSASLSSAWGTSAITNRDGSALGLCVLIDQTADGMYQDISTPPTETINSTATKVGLYLTEMYLFNNSVASGYNYSVVVTTSAYNGSTLLASVSEQVSVPYAVAPNDWVRYRQLADFREYVGSMTKVRISIVNAPGAPAGGQTRAMLVDDVSCYAITDTLFPVASSVAATPDNLVMVSADALNTTIGNAYVGYLRGRWVKRTVSAVDVSRVTDLAVKFRFPAAILEAGEPRMRMGLQEGSGTVYWSAYGAYDEANSIMSFDIGQINATARDAVTTFYIEIRDDILSPVLAEGDPVFFVGDIADPGLMTPDAQYEYLWTEWAPETAGNTPTSTGVESSGTNPSNSITTNSGFRSTVMVLNPAHTSLATNASATYIKVYRRAAGVFTDGQFRLVAQFPTATMAAGVSDTINGYWSTSQSSVEVTNAADIAFFDNTPDSAILYDNGPGVIGEVYRTGRDSFPTGATSIAVHQRRLWVGKGNTLYASWLLDVSNEYALYTTFVPNPDDPLLPIKGASFAISSPSDNEPIVSLLSYGSDQIQRDSSTSSVLIALREHSIHGVTGLDASQFASQQFLRQAGIGALAKRAAAIVQDRPWFLSGSGVMEFAGMQVAPRSLPLERVLNPSREAGGSYVTAAAYKLSAMVYHNRRLFLFAPVAGGSANSVAYVFDTRTGHWVKFTTPGFTSGVSLSGGGDTQDFFCAGSDGQLYRYNGYADKSTPAGSSTAISYSIQTRRHGQVSAEGVAYFAKNHPTQIDVHIFADASHTFTWAIYNENALGRTGTWSIPANTQKAVGIRAIPTDIDGNTHELQLSGSATGLVRLYALLFHATERGIARSR